VGLLFASFQVYFLRPEYDIDIWWHLKAGEHILQHGFPSTDIFNYQHPDKAWTTFEWLYEVLAWEVYSLGGFAALRIGNALLLTLGFALALRLSLALLEKRWLAFLALALLAALYHDRIRIRPHVVNLVLLLAVARPLLTRFQGATWRTYAWVIAVGLLWANLHAGGVLELGLMLFALWLGGLAQKWIDGATDVPLKPVFATGAILGLGLVLTPNFLQGMVTALSMYDATRIIIPEWQEATSYFEYGDAPHFYICGLFPYFMLLAMGLYGSWLMLRRHRHDILPDLMMSLPLLFMAHHSARYVHLGWFPCLLTLRWGLPELRRHAPSMGLAAAALGVFLLGSTVQYYYFIQRAGVRDALQKLAYDTEPTRFPVAAADFLVGAGVQGRVFNQTEWGGYLLFRMYPGSQVFCDGRGNLAQDELVAVIETHKPYSRAHALDVAFERHGLDLTVFKNPTFPEGRWDHSKWLRIYHDPEAEVFLRLNDRAAPILKRVLDFYRARGLSLTGQSDAEVTAFERAVAVENWRDWSGMRFNAERLQKLEAQAAGPDPLAAARARMRLAILWLRGDRLDQAREALDGLLRDNPFNARALVWAAYARYLLDPRSDGTGPARMALLLDSIPFYRVLGAPVTLDGSERLLAKQMLTWGTGGNGGPQASP
jgi:hypothetical protein